MPLVRRVPRTWTHSRKVVAMQIPADIPRKRTRSGGTGVRAEARASPRPTSMTATAVANAAEARPTRRRDAAASIDCGTVANGSAGPVRPVSLAFVTTVCRPRVLCKRVWASVHRPAPPRWSRRAGVCSPVTDPQRDGCTPAAGRASGGRGLTDRRSRSRTEDGMTAHAGAPRRASRSGAARLAACGVSTT